jgi:hypothetical protein
MQGVITIRDVMANVGIIVREFGAGCLLRCLMAAISGQKTTFLEVAFKRVHP